jgi:hypothetical protein
MKQIPRLFAREIVPAAGSGGEGDGEAATAAAKFEL